MGINLERIGWKNGVLVSKAKVEIDGIIHEIEPEQYSGDTPLSAENLKKMEDNAEEAINKIDGKLIGTVLYENETGTTGNITLSDTVANYDYIEIQCKRNDFIYATGKLSDVNKRTVSIGTNYTTATAMYIYAKTITFDEKQLTVVRANLAVAQGGNVSISSDDNNYITKVTGYKIS